MPLIHAEEWQSYLWFLHCPFVTSTACGQHSSQSPCFLRILFHPQLHPVWSGRSLSLSTRAFGKGSGKEKKMQQSEAELNSYAQDFQKPPTILYILLQSLTRAVFPEAGVQSFPQVRTHQGS